MALKLNQASEIYLASRFHRPSSIATSPFPLGLKIHDNLHPFRTTSLRPCNHPTLAPALSRRLFLSPASGIWDALLGGNSARDALAAVRQGMQLFRQGDVHGSLVEFDRTIELDPRQKACTLLGFNTMHSQHLLMLLLFQCFAWRFFQTERISFVVNGVRSLAKGFEEGAEQFRIDVAANPNDTEESIWCFLCEAQLYGVDEARRRFLEASPHLLILALNSGLVEIHGLSCVELIICSRMVVNQKRSDDYMASLAKVHYNK
ncbi:hypothetical protein ACLOJK_026307 [Asimina triloba]